MKSKRDIKHRIARNFLLLGLCSLVVVLITVFLFRLFPWGPTLFGFVVMVLLWLVAFYVAGLAIGGVAEAIVQLDKAGGGDE